MLRDNLDKIYERFCCSSAEIARYSGCSRSNVSRMYSGTRVYTAASRAVIRLAEGIYRMAESLGRLEELRALTGGEDISHDKLVPGLCAWLVDAEEIPSVERIRFQERGHYRKETLSKKKPDAAGFGKRLTALMEMGEYTNAELARNIHVDASLISRWRQGARSCEGNDGLSRRLVEELLRRIDYLHKEKELEQLSGIPKEQCYPDAGSRLLYRWLFSDVKKPEYMKVGGLLEYIAQFTKAAPEDFSFSRQRISDIPISDKYFGITGIRQAVIRFLISAAGEGGELFLYSDRDMEWMTGSEEFFQMWKMLMFNVLKKGVRITIIHNITRGYDEMIQAIQGWLPLYMTGLVNSFVCRRPVDARFSHTIFLNKGRACISGFSVRTSDETWVDYITQERQLLIREQEFEQLLTSSQRLIEIYTGHSLEERFREHRTACGQNYQSLGLGLPLVHLPENTLDEMLLRADCGPERTAIVKQFHARAREQFQEALSDPVYELVSLDEWAETGKSPVCELTPLLMNISLSYTEEEYRAHRESVIRLLESEKNYHLILLPQLPFADIRISVMQEKVVVIHVGEPMAAMVLRDSNMIMAFREYLRMLGKQVEIRKDKVIRRLRISN